MICALSHIYACSCMECDCLWCKARVSWQDCVSTICMSVCHPHCLCSKCRNENTVPRAKSQCSKGEILCYLSLCHLSLVSHCCCLSSMCTTEARCFFMVTVPFYLLTNLWTPERLCRGADAHGALT